MSKFTIDQDAIKALAQVLIETELNEIEYAVDNHRIRVARQSPQVIAPPMMAMHHHAVDYNNPSAAPLTDKSVKHPGAVESPMVGTAYLAPEPGAAAFVKAGDIVNQGDTLLIIESMKVMNPIRASRSGKISQVLVKDASPVEFGEVLMIIE
jgi:acetyl-CoA carboxylase biotin carboxyl carrier protein